MEKIRLNAAESLTIREGFDRFLRWCRIKNYAKRTTQFYEKTIHNFSLFHDLDNPVTTLNEEIMEEYALYLREKNISSMTMHTYLRGMKRIINYFAEKGMIENFDVEMPKVVTPVKEVYTTEELKKLLKKPDLKKCSFSEYRNWVIINYLLGTGQRRRTVANIKIGDMDLENGLVILRETKNKEQIVLPLTASLVMILEEYLSYRGGRDDDYLFCGRDGRGLSEETLTNAIRKYNLKRGVEHTSVHLFRHTFAYIAIKNNMDIVRLQRLLCHRSIKTTQGYLRSFGFEDLKDNYEMFNPLETFRNDNIVSKHWRFEQNRRKGR